MKNHSICPLGYRARCTAGSANNCLAICPFISIDFEHMLRLDNLKRDPGRSIFDPMIFGPMYETVEEEKNEE